MGGPRRPYTLSEYSKLADFIVTICAKNGNMLWVSTSSLLRPVRHLVSQSVKFILRLKFKYFSHSIGDSRNLFDRPGPVPTTERTLVGVLCRSVKKAKDLFPASSARC